MHQIHASPPLLTEKQIRLIFLRVPKSGSSTLQNIFYREYRGTPTLETGCGLLVPSQWDRFAQGVKAMPARERESYQTVIGHMKFGAHRLLPGRSEYVTFLRDPVRRFASYYYMLRRMGIVPSDHRIEPDRADWNLSAHETFARELDNGQTRALANADWDLPLGGCNEKHLEAAKANIDAHFAFVGLTEQFDLSLMLLKRLCGWRWHFYVSKNVTPRSTSREGLSPEVRAAITRLNRLDYQLYAHVKERLLETAASFGFSLRLEHAAYVAGNRVHWAINRVCHPAKEVLRKALRQRAGRPRESIPSFAGARKLQPQ